MSPSQHDLGFSFRTGHDGNVTILRSGNAVTILRRELARDFLVEIGTATFIEQQQLMARLTGNYKHGNERVASNHPRNRGQDDA